MALFEHPDVVGARDLAAALHQLVERSLQTPHPGRRHVVGQHEKAVGEKSRALGLGEHASGMLQHVLTQHASLPAKTTITLYVRRRSELLSFAPDSWTSQPHNPLDQ